MGTSVQQLVQIISDSTGVPVSRCRQVARRLLENGYLPSSNGRQIATVGNVDVIVLLLGALAPTEIYAVTGIVRQLFDLRADGKHTLGSRLVELLTTIRVLDTGADVAMDGQLILDIFTPRAVLRLNMSGEVVESSFAAPGIDAISDDEVRKLVVMPTIVLAKIAQALKANAEKAAA